MYKPGDEGGVSLTFLIEELMKGKIAEDLIDPFSGHDWIDYKVVPSLSFHQTPNQGGL
jgi:hypothetical protein